MPDRQSAHRESFGSREVLTSDLERAIREGALSPGRRLQSERELGLNYKLSRPVVREVLSGLAERGYIEIFPGRGSFVRTPNASDLSRPLVRIATNARVTARSLVEAREVLECAAARGAAQNASPTDLELLMTSLNAHEQATDLTERSRTDLDFHTTIVEISGNPVLGLMYGSIRAFVQALMLRSHSDTEVHALGDPLHREIADGILRHKPKVAVDAMRRHVSLALELYGADLDLPLVDVLIDRGINLEEFL